MKGLARERLIGLLLLAGVLLLGLLYVDLRDDRRVETARAATARLALAEATALRQQLVRSVSSVRALDAIIDQFKGAPEFQVLAADMIASYGGITNLQLAPDGVIGEIYPRRGNESALGLDLLDPSTPGSQEAQAAKEGRLLTVAGPLEVVQGGVALIARSPVFFDDSENENRFWGFVTALISVSDLLASSRFRQRLEENGYDFTLALASDMPGQPFASSIATALEDPVIFRFDVFGKQWELGLVPRGGWSDTAALAQDALLALFVTVLVGTLVWIQLHRPAQLEAQVARNTEDLNTANLNLMREIDERKAIEVVMRQNEARYRGVLEYASDALFVYDLQGRFVEANPEACRQLGYSREELLALTLKDVAPRENFTDSDAEIVRLMAGETVNINGRVCRKDGNEYPVEVRIGRFKERGNPLFIGVARDMSERTAIREAMELANIELERRVDARTYELRQINRNLIRETRDRQRIESELLAAKATADEASEEKSQFLRIISHEIRTPMNGMLGMISLLRESDLPTDLQSYAEVATASGKLLMGLLGELVDISRIERYQPTVHRIEVEPARLLSQVTELHKWRAKEKGLEMHLDCAPELPAWVLIDADRLRQVVNNLVGNAVKFTESGEVRVVADCPRDDWLRVVVSDTGVGIDSKSQETIFDSFTQADRSIARRYGGSGLGLAITHQLVEIMEGTINLESQTGAGSTFVVELPAQSVTQDRPDSPQTDARLRLDEPYRVLVAEDNAINRKVAIGMLQRLGCEVTAVKDGQEAVNRLLEETFDIVLMDCQMPNMDGFAATRKLRRRETDTNHVPVVAMTAHVLPEDVAHCLAAGMDDHISKPVTLERLRRVITRWARSADGKVDG